MKKYEPKELVAVSRYRNFFSMLPAALVGWLITFTVK